SEGEAPVGQTVAWIGEPGEEIAAPAEAPPAPEETPEPGSSETNQVRELEAPASTSNGRIKASPLARRIAREKGIDLSTLQGTGPEGRIIAEDVERGTPAVRAAAAPVGEVESIPLTSIRKTIARRLTAAWQAPVFQLTVSADMTRANELVAKSR